MTLVIKKPTGSKLVMRKGWKPMDPDAATYIAAVEAADGQALEEKTKIAIDNFVLGCKADGIWSAFEQCAILCGARTRQGAVIPLVKPSGNADPTFHGTAGGWTYNRKTGLAGNGTDNYVDTKYVVPNGNQNNCHLAVWKTTATGGGGNPYWIGSLTAGFGQISAVGASGMYPCSPFAVGTGAEAGSDIGLHGWTRGASNPVNYKRPEFSIKSSTVASATPDTTSMFLFNINNAGTPGGTQWSSAPLAFYSAGKNVDLLLLSARIAGLINAIGAAF